MNNNTTGKIVLHLCGGAGINLGKHVFEELEVLGDGFADFDLNYLDTSGANIDNVKYPEKFFKIENIKASKDGLDGSGGERAKNAEDIMENIKKYLDDKKLYGPKLAEYHFIVFSASGGSGNVQAAGLAKGLLERNIPTALVIVGDSSNGLSASNTSKTLATLNNIAKMTKKAINVIYVNNQSYASDKLNKANQAIYNTMATMALFLSNQNHDIDAQDMVNLIDQSQYTTTTFKPGLYGMVCFSKDVEIPNGCIPMVGRSLTVDNIPADPQVKLWHHKTGSVLSKNANEIMGKQYPIHVLTYANFFSTENTVLKKIVSDYDNIMNQINIEDIGNDDADENGMVF